MTMHTDHHSHEPWADLPAGFADHLDREAKLSAPLRLRALEWVDRTLTESPTHIVDLGSGTGRDAVALAQRYPTARVHALDVSSELLARVRTAAASADVADRVEVHPADLNADWRSEVPGEVGLVWAALSLHHVDDPSSALHRAYAALRPGGVLVLTELTGENRFTADSFITADSDLQRLIESQIARHEHASVEWSSLLAQAGFSVMMHEHHDVVADTATDEGREYLERMLQMQRERARDDLSGRDLARLDDLLAGLGDGRSQISLRSGREIWVVSRPMAEDDQRLKPEDAEVAEDAEATEVAEAEVAVVGGGYAGLAAAIALARSRRRVVVIDDGHPRNEPAEGAHNVLGNEGISPTELLARGRAEAESYGVRIIHAMATGASGEIDDFTVELDGAEHRLRVRRIIIATGLVDDLPEIPGVREGWGRSVLHCPFCHGWEVRDRRIAVFARGELALHQVLLFRQLTDQVTLFLHESSDPTDEQREQLAVLNVPVVRGKVERLVMGGSQVHAVQVEGGQRFNADAVVVAPQFHARAELFESLGGRSEQTPFGSQIPSDDRGMTPVPGVWAAGNSAQPMAMVVASSASGVTTGAAVHGDLTMNDLARAVREGDAGIR